MESWMWPDISKQFQQIGALESEESGESGESSKTGESRKIG